MMQATTFSVNDRTWNIKQTPNIQNPYVLSVSEKDGKIKSFNQFVPGPSGGYFYRDIEEGFKERVSVYFSHNSIQVEVRKNEQKYFYDDWTLIDSFVFKDENISFESVKSIFEQGPVGSQLHCRGKDYYITISLKANEISISSETKLPEDIDIRTFKVDWIIEQTIQATSELSSTKLYLTISNVGVQQIRAFGEIRKEVGRISSKSVKELVGQFKLW